MSNQNNKVKRHLIDDMEAHSSDNAKKKKSSTRSQEQPLLPGSKQQSTKTNRLNSKGKRQTKAVKNAVKKKLKGKNNNAVPEQSKTQQNKTGKIVKNGKSKNSIGSKANFVPIIQTRRMKNNSIKSKILNDTEEREFLNKIDTLSSAEVATGNLTDNEDQTMDETDISHDGVELSIQGSDIDEDNFPDADAVTTTNKTAAGNAEADEEGQVQNTVNLNETESGELSASDDKDV